VKELFKRGSTTIVIGPGGVGKTTVAAAIGLASASRGLATGVITVDPARRLREALGMERLNARPIAIDARRLRSARLDPTIRLSAMVLDVPRAWDGLVERFVPSAAARRSILANSFYQGLSRQFAGAEGYAALDRCYELHSGGNFEAVVVDTPPAAHAFELIEAPAHLLRLLDSRAARMLARSRGSARGPLTLAGSAAQFVMAKLEQFAGVRMLSPASEFFAATADAAGALSDRFRAIEALLRSPAVQFVLVTTAEPNRLAEARAVATRMDAEGLRLCAVVMNRLMDQRSFAALSSSSAKSISERLAMTPLRLLLANFTKDPKIKTIAAFLEHHADVIRGNLERAAAFAAKLPASTELIIAPEFEDGLRDLSGLKQIADTIGRGGGRRFLSGAAIAGQAERPRRARKSP
jgi:anion-transporting  ArsA/GET3 family ATPase